MEVGPNKHWPIGYPSGWEARAALQLHADDDCWMWNSGWEELQENLNNVWVPSENDLGFNAWMFDYQEVAP